MDETFPFGVDGLLRLEVVTVGGAIFFEIVALFVKGTQMRCESRPDLCLLANPRATRGDLGAWLLTNGGFKYA